MDPKRFNFRQPTNPADKHRPNPTNPANIHRPASTFPANIHRPTSTFPANIHRPTPTNPNSRHRPTPINPTNIQRPTPNNQSSYRHIPPYMTLDQMRHQHEMTMMRIQSLMMQRNAPAQPESIDLTEEDDFVLRAHTPFSYEPPSNIRLIHHQPVPSVDRNVNMTNYNHQRLQGNFAYSQPYRPTTIHIRNAGHPRLHGQNRSSSPIRSSDVHQFSGKNVHYVNLVDSVENVQQGNRNNIIPGQEFVTGIEASSDIQNQDEQEVQINVAQLCEENRGEAVIMLVENSASLTDSAMEMQPIESIMNHEEIPIDPNVKLSTDYQVQDEMTTLFAEFEHHCEEDQRMWDILEFSGPCNPQDRAKILKIVKKYVDILLVSYKDGCYCPQSLYTKLTTLKENLDSDSSIDPSSIYKEAEYIQNEVDTIYFDNL